MLSFSELLKLNPHVENNVCSNVIYRTVSAISVSIPPVRYALVTPVELKYLNCRHSNVRIGGIRDNNVTFYMGIHWRRFIRWGIQRGHTESESLVDFRKATWLDTARILQSGGESGSGLPDTVISIEISSWPWDSGWGSGDFGTEDTPGMLHPHA